jgi:hypothetical protein
MNEDQNFNERGALNAERAQLMSSLSANTSAIGDWKITKILEARLLGENDPYDLNTLASQRQAARQRINEIDIELKRLDGVEPTAEELLALAKARKQSEITAHDNSANVNSFIIGGLPMWLVWELRARLKDSLDAAEANSETEMTKPFGGIEYTFPIAQWRQMVNAVEKYADDCQKVTAAHRAAVEALNTVKKVENYDYTTGYPTKINFDEMFANAE